MAIAPLPLLSVACLGDPGDNAAIALRSLNAGEAVLIDGTTRVLRHTMLEGHRFAVRPIALGQPLLAWGCCFGRAIRPIAPGDYVCNEAMLSALALRRHEADLPSDPNFADAFQPYALEAGAFHPAPPIQPAPSSQFFLGYRRPGSRGTGTRNFIVILGTSSRTGAFARQLAERLEPLARAHPTFDGIVALAHTEGGSGPEPNNAAEVLRALAGFLVHPNVGAVLAVDYGTEPINNARLDAYLKGRDYAMAEVPHRFLTLRRSLADDLAEGEAIVRSWLPLVAAQTRTHEPLSGLRIALQCGGSDAFSGLTGNRLAGAVTHEVIRQGGSSNLCETDELIGAESYLLENIRDLATARALVGAIDRFRERLSWHGVTAESNPSAGNRYRGLYNIALKSLGAAQKKDPRTRIDAVIDYAAPMQEPGFYFMDSPGNDLEGIAGQVAAGCNLILFVTGSGSVTNFPFVPTLKITTTTRRHELLVREMDVNAGRILDGESLESLAAETFALTVRTASGHATRGEHAGHSQVSLWRNWRQSHRSQLSELESRAAPNGRPLVSRLDPSVSTAPQAKFHMRQNGSLWATEFVGLVLPTSMCSSQIARMAADRMNARGVAREQNISRFVALPHTEGCGFGGESTKRLLQRTFSGYVTHPNAAMALLLEHGCETIPNDLMRGQLEAAGESAARFGWASVQLDGGIDSVLLKMERWFEEKAAALPSPAPFDVGFLNVGLMSACPIGAATAGAFANLAARIIRSGGSIILPESDPLLASDIFRRRLLGNISPTPTLAYGQAIAEPGFHVMAAETDHWVEALSGLGACGAHVFLALVAENAQPGHPMLPVLQIAEPGRLTEGAASDVDLFLAGELAADEAALLRLLQSVAEGAFTPRANLGGFTDFQLTRGLLGVST